ncbi:MAG: Laminin sub domain 2, partial [Gemmatimonadetes bacterium]|nr:Laminin sub domain 2 [Gemmatimonadota bacterium]
MNRSRIATASLCPLGLALAVLLAVGAAEGQTPWTKDVDNPVLAGGGPGEWDQGGVACGAAIFDGTTYHLWYAGIRTQWPDIDIGYATSPDGVTWTKHPDNPVLERGAAGAWDSGSVFPSAVVWDGATYHMWYVSASGSVTQTGYATSPDGVTWTKHPDNPVLERGAAGAWDSGSVFPSAVVWDGATYRMWYVSASGSVTQTGYATSPDGVTWTKHPDNPVLRAGDPGSWDETKADIHAVLAEGGTYRAWYNGRGAGASWEQIGYATSPDGVTWTKHPDPVLPRDGTGWDGYTVANASIAFDGTYHMWYSGAGNKAQIGHASSSDGIHWVRQPADEPALPTGGAGAWDTGGVDLSQVLLVGDTAHMWYTGWIGGLQSMAIGHATAQLPLPASCPELVGRWPYGSTWAVAISGGYAYYGNGTALMVAEVFDPAAPQVVGEVVLPDPPQVIAASAGYAYVADWRGGLRVIDVRIPSAPAEVAFLDTPGQVARDVAVSGSYAYVTAGYDGLLVIDVSTPSAPVEVGVIDTPYWASGIAVDGGYAYVAEIKFPGAGGSLRVIDVSTPSAPVEVGFVDTPGWA